jgi:non-ribosomal peptide synthetase component E (peptide arylation enzyme)
MNIGMLVSQQTKRISDKLAFVFGDHRFTYLEYNQNVNRLANALLDIGVRKGNRGSLKNFFLNSSILLF